MAAALLAAAPMLARAATFYVDTDNPSATDAGPGTEAVPYKTITAAANQHGGPGNTILVKPGTYREQVTVPTSGALGSPFVIQALGSPVILEGADDFGTTGQWAPFSGNVFLASTVTTAPTQVFADGARLTPSAGPPASLPSGSFVFVGGEGLYANVGGDNPGSHSALVGRRSHGFRLPGRSYVTIQGFVVQHTEDKGIYLLTMADHSVVSGNTVRFANTQGISVTGCTDALVENNVVSQNNDHGISLLMTGGSTVRGNESFLNARPVGVDAATGIILQTSSGNRVERNRTHDNEDTGIQMSGGANSNVSVQNRSWKNGDHGFDHLNSSGCFNVGDVAWANTTDGFSIEGNSLDNRVFDCIATENGEFDLFVDPTSTTGFMSDYNIFWNSTAQTVVRFNAIFYTSVADYSAATGHDAHSTQADPKFVNPAAGDFHLQPGSPAIDAATSAVPNWPATDAEGNSRFDDPATPNTGTGPIPFADRGALELQGVIGPPGDHPPVVVAPSDVLAREKKKLTFKITASDPDHDPITSLRFESNLPAGNDARLEVSSGNTRGTFKWKPKSGDAGTYFVTFIAENALAGTSTTTITVANRDDHAPNVKAPGSVHGDTNHELIVNVTASDPDGDPITSLSADLTELPSGAVFTPNGTNTSGTLRWTPENDDAGKYKVTFIARNSLVGTKKTEIHIKREHGHDDGDDNDDGDDLLADNPLEGQGLAALPTRLMLFGAAPNPSRSQVTFALDLPRQARVEWSIFDLQGRRVWSESSERPAGHDALRWSGLNRDGARAAAGIYLVRVNVGGVLFARRFVRL